MLSVSISFRSTASLRAGAASVKAPLKAATLLITASLVSIDVASLR